MREDTDRRRLVVRTRDWGGDAVSIELFGAVMTDDMVASSLTNYGLEPDAATAAADGGRGGRLLPRGLDDHNVGPLTPGVSGVARHLSGGLVLGEPEQRLDRKSTRLNSSHLGISY